MRRLSTCLFVVFLCAACLVARAAEPASPITESARQLPLAYDVDVVVVGGGTGAVAAAAAAAQAGAKVFLAAPRPYLGEDVCATMRLWLEEGETPAGGLAAALFSKEGLVPTPTNIRSMKFTYTADQPAAKRHLDTKIPSKLNDGLIGQSNSDSVEFGSDVAITADLGEAQTVQTARVVMFYRGGDFGADSVEVQASDDAQNWKTLSTVKCQPEGDMISVSAPVGVKSRYFRFGISRGRYSRVLLGEIALEPAGKPELDRPPAKGLQGPYRPMHLKKALDKALLDAGVQFLYGCYATDVLRDAAGVPCGIVMANRAGRQAVRAKVIIDATDRAAVARMAGAAFQPYPAGPQEFKYVAIGGEPQSGEGIVNARVTGLAYATRDIIEPKPGERVPGGIAPIIEYTLSIPMADGGFASMQRAEQIARGRTTNENIKFLTDELFQVPPDPLKSVKPAQGKWAGVDALDLRAFQPADVKRLFVLGGCADLPRPAAEQLLRPTALTAMGARIGAAAAKEAKSIKKIEPAPVSMPSMSSISSTPQIKEILTGVRPVPSGSGATVASPARDLPVLGRYDVVVIGAGTGGAPAGIGAARNGAKTLVIEYLHGMGGVGTLGLISKYYHGYRGGFTKEVFGGADWDPIQKAEWLRAEVVKAGAEVWYGAIGCGAVVENGKVTGVIVATPQGRGVVLAGVVIDATGNADVAAAAGAETVFIDATEPAVQGTGLPAIKPGSRYTNTDFTIIDETDVLDVWHALVYAKDKYPNAFDLGQLVDSRERRRIVGDFTMTLPDAMNGRTYPDTIHIAQSNFDTHGMTVDPYLLVEHPERRSITVNVPYRCLLPKGLDGILVIGLGVSAHRDAMPLIRMQPDIQNQGYAAGLVAATAVKNEQTLRGIDLPAIQKRLVELEILPKEALGAKDSYPYSAERIAAAIETAAKDGTGMSAIVTHPQTALPLLRKAYAKATDEKEKLMLAKILAVLRDPAGAMTLAATVAAEPWDKGWNYTGGGQYGSALSPYDTLIVALARTGDKRVLGPILIRAAQLDAQSDFSHVRAVALALEDLKDPKAANVLAGLLNKPGMRGWVITDPRVAAVLSGGSPGDNSTRQTSIREVSLARALYRCGDKDGLGRQILEDYRKDLRGYLARHVAAVLEQK